MVATPADRRVVGAAGVEALDGLKRFQPAEARHLDVERHQVGRSGADEVERLFAAEDGAGYGDPFLPGEGLPQRGTEDARVIDDQHSCGVGHRYILF